MEEIVHIIPLGLEFDRAIIPFEGRQGFKPNRVYLLTIKSTRDAPANMIQEHVEKAQKVKDYFLSKNVEVIEIDTKLINIRDVMGKVSGLICKEKNLGNRVYINMSSAGRLTSLGVTLSGMFHDAKVYYVRADRYSENELERKERGITICDHREIIFIENFKMEMPKKLKLKVLVELNKRGKMRTVDIIQFLSNLGAFGYVVDYFNLSRSEKTSIIMKVNRNILDKLEASEYITKKKLGRENEYVLTESGSYMASISGQIPIKVEDVFREP
ncbi:MAG: DUF6293 family protein [archaeon]